MPEKQRALNLEILDCLSDFSGYIEHDPMSLFYCLFFCIYYNNPEMVEVLRSMINRMPHIIKIEKLLEVIDEHGIDKIRKTGEQINSIIYHMVFYQAVDDDLRIVYA